jgi:hypothetical protein
LASNVLWFDPGEVRRGWSQNPERIPVYVNHDLTVDVGHLERVYTQEEWWRVAFVLDQEITDELQPGQPVSIGISEWKWGSISLDEVSVVRRGAVRDAETIRDDRFSKGPPCYLSVSTTPVRLPSLLRFLNVKLPFAPAYLPVPPVMVPLPLEALSNCTNFPFSFPAASTIAIEQFTLF